MTTKPSAKTILSSISPDGIILTTMEITCHRFVLAELNTHRAFSRNAASSRAIPTKKIRERVEFEPAYPVVWGSNKAGMQAGEPLEVDDEIRAREIWDYLRRASLFGHKLLEDIGLHKQWANRILEPWMWVTDIVSFTDIDNFFWQRCDVMAQPEFKAVADEMQREYFTAKPKLLDYGQWHLPYIQSSEKVEIREYAENRYKDEPITHSKYSEKYTEIVDKLESIYLKAISTARCARVSYLNHNGVRSIEDDIDMHDNKLKAYYHPSPFEHVATPCPEVGKIKSANMMYENLDTHNDWQIRCKKWGNFYGWDQYRKELENENRQNFVPNLPELQGDANA